MQYIPDGGLAGLQITNEAAAGLRSLSNDIARRRRQKSSLLFDQGRILGNDKMMAQAADMFSQDKVEPRTFIDQDGNQFGGTYDQVRMQAERGFLDKTKNMTYLDKLKERQKLNSFLVDVNTVYNRPFLKAADEEIYTGGGGGGGGKQSEYGMKFINPRTGKQDSYTYYAQANTDYTNKSHEASMVSFLKKKGFTDKEVKDIMSQQDFVPNIAVNAASADKSTNALNKDVDYQARQEIDVANDKSIDDAITAENYANYHIFGSNDMPNLKQQYDLNKKARGRYSIKINKQGKFYKDKYDPDYNDRVNEAYISAVRGNGVGKTAAQEEEDYFNGK